LYDSATPDATCGAGTAYPSGARDFTPIFSVFWHFLLLILRFAFDCCCTNINKMKNKGSGQFQNILYIYINSCHKENFEDTKEEISSRKSKDRQCSGQQKRDK
jgi:hypothetical protein